MNNEIIYPELSYKIVGILFEIHRELGPRYQEKYYSRAVALGFERAGLRFERELKVNLIYNNQIIGKYYLDFLVEDKIVVELKTVGGFSNSDIKQILGYLYAKNLRLGILVNFRSDSLEYKRILNSKYKN